MAGATPLGDLASAAAVAPSAATAPAAAAAPLLLATDCSGVGSPFLVLLRMGLPCRHLWASDSEKACRTMLRHHCAPEMLFRSIEERPRDELPQPDLYVVGFPCQPFSGAGCRLGFAGEGGKIFFEVLRTIRLTQPRAFLLENVDGLRSAGGGACLDSIVDSLLGLQSYNIYWRSLNTKDYGIPHNRARIFFVGILRIHDNGSFSFPAATPPLDIKQFLDPRRGRPSFADLPPLSATTARDNVTHYLHEIEASGSDPFFEPWIIDCDSSPPFAKAFLGVAPCITRGRCKGHWITSMGRRMNLPEALRMQGFDDNFENPVTERQLRQMLGNSMSLNILELIFRSLLPAAGLIVAGDVDSRIRQARICFCWGGWLRGSLHYIFTSVFIFSFVSGRMLGRLGGEGELLPVLGRMRGPD
jgi:DNA (cytosine-5)-methyltransferase 1